MNLYLHSDPLENGPAQMARDAALLRFAAELPGAVLRWYGWEGVWFSFGYTQSWADAVERAQGALPGSAPEAVLVRRPSGGGWVDHRGSWTFALVLPSHGLGGQRSPRLLYCQVHRALAQALQQLGIPATLAPESPAGGKVCFLQAVTSDVIDPDSGRKIAGAALKRTRHGVLCQGSIRLPTLEPTQPGGLPADSMVTAFAAELQGELELDAVLDGPPACVDDEAFISHQEREIAKFSSAEWNQRS